MASPLAPRQEREWWDIASDIVDPTGAPVVTNATWSPFPKQQIAENLSTQVDELLFGGAAGPGKSEWGMRHVIRQMEIFPGNRGAIFRRVFPSLNRTIIPRLKIMLHGRARYNSVSHTFSFPNGSELECASLQFSGSEIDHQGAEYGVIFFEEITEFLQSQWEYLIGRLRAPVMGVHPHAIATTNPGGTGHRWVKRRWVKPRAEDLEDGQAVPHPMQIWTPKATLENPEPLTRVYVPATNKDNPALLKKDPGYIRRLRNQSDRGLRMAMELGDWDAIDAIEGALWTNADLEAGRLTKRRFNEDVSTLLRVVSVDPSDGDETEGAKSDGFGIAVCSKGYNFHGYVERCEEWNSSVRKMAQGAVDLYHEVGADALVIERNHGGKWMVEVFRSVDPTANIVTTWASDGKRTRARPISNLFEEVKGAQGDDRYRCHMVGYHEMLEEELTTHNFDTGMSSPNRLDAMVWGLSYLMLGDRHATNEGPMRDNRLRGRR